MRARTHALQDRLGAGIRQAVVGQQGASLASLPHRLRGGSGGFRFRPDFRSVRNSSPQNLRCSITAPRPARSRSVAERTPVTDLSMPR